MFRVWSAQPSIAVSPLAVATPAAPYRSLPGPPGPESRLKSVSKESPGASGPRGPKSVRNSLKTVFGVSKESVLRLRRLFRDCFGHYLDPGVGRAAGVATLPISPLLQTPEHCKVPCPTSQAWWGPRCKRSSIGRSFLEPVGCPFVKEKLKGNN